MRQIEKSGRDKEKEKKVREIEFEIETKVRGIEKKRERGVGRLDSEKLERKFEGQR